MIVLFGMIAQNGIRILCFAGPLLFIVLGFILVSRYQVTEKNHKIIMDEIQSRKDGNGNILDMMGEPCRPSGIPVKVTF